MLAFWLTKHAVSRAIGALAVASLAIALLACAPNGSREPSGQGPPRVLVDGARVAHLDVGGDAGALSASARALLDRYEVGAALRQSTLDWLDERGAFDPEGELDVLVQIRSVRLRSAAVALLLGSLGGEDRLATFVVVTRDAVVVKTFEAEASSSSGGRGWRDPAERIERLARMLGRRIVEHL